jgi:ParB family chromosome partitioning protein
LSERGIDVFFPQEGSQPAREVPGARFQLIDPNKIVPNAQQPRSEFRPEDLAELEHSIREFGVLQPIVVRPLSGTGPDATFELVMGERRLRASKAVGLDAIPAVVRQTEDADMLRDALLENLHRAQLNALEEASAYQQLLEDFGITQDELAKRIGRSRPQVTNTLRLLRLPIKVQQRVAAGVISAGHARAILSVTDAVGQ